MKTLEEPTVYPEGGSAVYHTALESILAVFTEIKDLGASFEIYLNPIPP